MKLRLLDLFSGIGGFSLGLERSGGFQTVAFCEIDKFCRRVLAKHWPEVPCYDDVRQLTAERLAADGITVDAICGGFPCQDISVAGKGAGLAGERSGLWKEYARIIGEVRPRFVIVENVAALLSRGLADVLGELAALGYDAEWHCIPASAVGAPHRRDRLWIVAYANRMRQLQPQGSICDERGWIGDGCEDVADTDSKRFRNKEYTEAFRASGDCEEQTPERERFWTDASAGSFGGHVSDALRSGLERYGNGKIGAGEEYAAIGAPCWWSSEPSVGRMAHGVPNRVDRLRSLGNAVVPQIPELIGRAIMESMR